MKLNLFVCYFFFSLFAATFAEIPKTISYQGVLTDEEGNPLADGGYKLEFELHTTPDNGDIPWQETHQKVAVENGIFNVILGSISPLAIPFDEPYFLAIKVNDGRYLEPFIPLTASPYSLGLADSIIVGKKIADGQVMRTIVLDSDSPVAIADSLTIKPGANIEFDIDVENRTLVISTEESGSGDGHSLDAVDGDPVNALFVDEQANVGIGTSEPGARLHVLGGDILVEDDFPVLNLGGTGSNKIISFRQFPGNTEQASIFYSNSTGLRARVGSNDGWVLSTSGNLGIGLTSPQRKLHVHLDNNNVTTSQMLISQSGEGDAWMNFGLDGSTHYAIGIDNSDDDKFKIGYSSSSASGVGENTLLAITQQGNVGIKSSTPTARLHIGQGGQSVGTGLRFDDGVNEVWDITHGFGLRLHFGGSLRGFFNASTGAYTQSSDLRLKSGVEDMNEMLSKVRQLKPKRYHYIGAESEKSIGFIAQEIADLFPELVHYSEADDVYGIDYSGFGVVAIKAIQEQQTVIDNQQKLIEALSQRLGALERKIN